MNTVHITLDLDLGGRRGVGGGRGEKEGREGGGGVVVRVN